MNTTWMHTAPICNPPLSQVDIHHLNNGLGQDLLWPNANNCGVVMLVQNGQAAASPTLESEDGDDKPLDLRHFRKGTRQRFPRRSQSAPAVCDLCHHQSGHGQLKSRSHSLAHLPTSGGENT